MMIDQLSQKTILVTLMRDDMERYRLDFNADGGDTRSGLTRLMVRIGEECGLDHAGKSYLIEALPAGDSCLLIISVREQKRRRRYRIKRTRQVDCCIFDCADALLDWIQTNTEIGGSIYTYADSYYLLPDYPFAPRLRIRLGEYGCVRALGAVEAARVREHGMRVGDSGARRVPHPRSAQ